MTSKKVLGALSLAAVLGVAGLGVAGANAETTADVTYQASLAQSIDISSDDPSVNLTLTNGGEVQSDVNVLTYNSNSASGYTITASVTGDTNLTSGDDTIPYSTSAVTKGTSGWNLTGDSILNFNSGTTATVATDTSNANGATKNITFSAAASDAQAAGTYTKAVTYTIAAQ